MVFPILRSIDFESSLLCDCICNIGIAFAVVLIRSMNLRTPLVAEKEEVDSVNFTRLTISISAVCIKHVFTAGTMTIVEMMFELNLRGNRFLYSKYFRHIFKTLLAINYSTNIFVYFVIDPKFRKEFRYIFFLKSCTKPARKWN